MRRFLDRLYDASGALAAVCLAAIRSLAAAGAPEVLVFSDPSESGPDRLYESVGFEPVTVHRRHEQSRP